ncbi:MAG: energy transducer TonB [Pseudomonadota bacterium]|nr:energy transducer TonB [Pseudomonadota bacterium]MEC9193067.1 energy transducer TonB [Pseudomonadota bacterium]
MYFYSGFSKLKFIFLLLGLSFVSSVFSDTGYITVDGETIEIEVERSYQTPATYPRKALRLEREGYVIIEFDVAQDGSVIDPYVLEGEPAGLFNRAAMKSIRKWIYEPSNYDGVPVQVNDVQVRINFNLTAIE